MNKLNKIDFVKIRNFMSEQNNTNCSITENSIFNNIWIKGEDFSTELYLKMFNNSLIISRLQLQNKHNGIGTEILNMLIDYCNDKKITSIIAESVLTKPMINFCTKHGFKPVKFQTYVLDNEIYGNYKLDLQKEK